MLHAELSLQKIIEKKITAHIIKERFSVLLIATYLHFYKPMNSLVSDTFSVVGF